MSSKLLALGIGWVLGVLASAVSVDSAERGAAKSQEWINGADLDKDAARKLWLVH